MPGRSAANAEGSQAFVVIGENVHTTRVVRRPGPLVEARRGRPRVDRVRRRGGRDAPAADPARGAAHAGLPGGPGQARPQRRARRARRRARRGRLGLAYLHAARAAAGRGGRAVPRRQRRRVLAPPARADRGDAWLVGELAPIAPACRSRSTPRTSRSSAPAWRRRRPGEPPMLNSASLERAEALELAAETGGAVIVTAAGRLGHAVRRRGARRERQRDDRARARARHPDGAHLRRPAGLPDLGRRRVRRALPRRRSASCASASGPSCTSPAA